MAKTRAAEAPRASAIFESPRRFWHASGWTVPIRTAQNRQEGVQTEVNAFSIQLPWSVTIRVSNCGHGGKWRADFSDATPFEKPEDAMREAEQLMLASAQEIVSILTDAALA